MWMWIWSTKNNSIIHKLSSHRLQKKKPKHTSQVIKFSISLLEIAFKTCNEKQVAFTLAQYLLINARADRFLRADSSIHFSLSSSACLKRKCVLLASLWQAMENEQNFLEFLGNIVCRCLCCFAIRLACKVDCSFKHGHSCLHYSALINRGIVRQRTTRLSDLTRGSQAQARPVKNRQKGQF